MATIIFPLVTRGSEPPLGPPLPNINTVPPLVTRGSAAPPLSPPTVVKTTKARNNNGYTGHGAGFIAGTVKVEGTPASRRVRLYELRTAKLIGETLSAPDGAYRFEYVDPSLTYYVIAFDHKRVHNAAIADIVTPVAMP
jgi:hypothetical protein